MHLQYDEIEQAVVDEDAVPDFDIGRQLTIGDRNIARPRDCLRSEDDVASLEQHDRGGKVTDADARSLQVTENRDRASNLLRQRADGTDHLRMLFVRPMREVDSSDVHSRRDERAQHPRR